MKELSVEIKKEADIWNRKMERTNENNRTTERGDNSPKAWVDAVSPTFEKEEDKNLDGLKSDKDADDVKQTFDKLSLDKRDDSLNEDGSEQQMKEEKREKGIRNRTSSGGSIEFEGS